MNIARDIAKKQVGAIMMRYPVLIGGELGAYGVTFPGFDAVAGGAMGATVDEALRNAEDVLADVVEMMEEKGEPIPPPVSLEEVVVEPGEMVAYVTLNTNVPA